MLEYIWRIPGESGKGNLFIVFSSGYVSRGLLIHVPTAEVQVQAGDQLLVTRMMNRGADQ